MKGSTVGVSRSLRASSTCIPIATSCGSSNPRCDGKIAQGVTTEIGGNCGSSVAPLARRRARAEGAKTCVTLGLEPAWSDFDEFFELGRTQRRRPATSPRLAGLGTTRALRSRRPVAGRLDDGRTAERDHARSRSSRARRARRFERADLHALALCRPARARRLRRAPRAKAARRATSRTCAAKATSCSRRSTKRSTSAGAPTSPSSSRTTKPPARRIGAKSTARWPRSSARAAKDWRSMPTCIRTSRVGPTSTRFLPDDARDGGRDATLERLADPATAARRSRCDSNSTAAASGTTSC